MCPAFQSHGPSTHKGNVFYKDAKDVADDEGERAVHSKVAMVYKEEDDDVADDKGIFETRVVV